MSKTASHAQKATQYFKLQACGATKWSRMPGFLEYLANYPPPLHLSQRAREFPVQYREVLP